jgi:hypothetical protein
MNNYSRAASTCYSLATVGTVDTATVYRTRGEIETHNVVKDTEGMSTPTEGRGDLLIRNLWKHQTDCILDVHITNLGAPSNIHRKPEAVILSQEREKKKYLQACLDQRRHFSPFVVSCDGVLGKEAKVVLQNLTGSLAKKSGKYYKLQEVKDEHCNSTSHTSMHPRITYPHEPNEPTPPSGKMEPASACTNRRTTDDSLSQN